MEPFENLLGPVAIFVKIGFLVSSVYYLVITSFNWQKWGRAMSFFLVLAIGISLVSQIRHNHFKPDNISCTLTTTSVYLCNGWPIYFDWAYQIAKGFEDYLNNSALIRNQSIAVGGLFLLVQWTELAKSINNGVKAIANAFIVGGSTLLILSNLGWLTGAINEQINFILSAGSINLEADIKSFEFLFGYIDEVIAIQEDMSKVSISSVFSFTESIQHTFSIYIAKACKFVIGGFSLLNLCFLFLQQIIVIALPFIGIFSFLMGSFDPMKLIRFLCYGAILRLFVIGQVFGFKQISLDNSSSLLDASGNLASGVLVTLCLVAVVGGLISMIGFGLAGMFFVKEILPAGSTALKLVRKT